MRKSVRRNAAHLNLIRSSMFSLPLKAARVLYKCILATFATAARRAQKAATNVGADISSGSDLSEDEYLAALGTLGSQWDRAEKKSRRAFHNLRCLDEATILGKMRASVPRYATGGFDHAIASIDLGEGASGEELCLDNAVEHANKAVEAYQRPVEEKENVVAETMAPRDTLATDVPVEVTNYAVW